MQKNEKIERIIQSTEFIKPVEPNPYLFNKVLHRLKSQAEETYVKNPVLVWTSMTVLTLFIAVNIYVITTTGKTNTTNEINSVANAYGLNEEGGLNYE